MNWSAPSTGNARSFHAPWLSTMPLRPHPVRKILEIELAAHPRQRHEFDIGMVEALIDLLVLVAALLDVPSREPVLDFSVGARILLEHDHQRAALGEDAGDFRAGRRATDHRHHVAR